MNDKFHFGDLLGIDKICWISLENLTKTSESNP
ncbi:unnamed protein product [Thelazia callipaeda]|uniref:Uncharacterized protein n=1 Tax=Thelazia callipaeda TaxID=103827 RepID=A0A0N5CLG8_THECL|nr:unnamed protein product [Thelazia callipaeda]